MSFVEESHNLIEEAEGHRSSDRRARSVLEDEIEFYRDIRRNGGHASDNFLQDIVEAPNESIL